MSQTAIKKWCGKVPSHDDFGSTIVDEFIDGKTVHGPWAKMSPLSWQIYGVGVLGTGLGQRYKKTGGEWIKVEG